MKLRGKSGREYIYAVEALEHRGPPPGIGPSGFLLRWSVAFLVSGLICYLLTRYLTAPSCVCAKLHSILRLVT